MPNRSKKLIRIISICIITALFVGMVLNPQTKVVQASEAFLQVQREWTSNSEDDVKTFTVLEVVDNKSSIGADAYGNTEIILGEEEIGFLIAGAEPYREYYLELVGLSKAYSNGPQPNINSLDKVKVDYESLVEELQPWITTDTVMAPLSQKEIVYSFKTEVVGYDNSLRFVEKVSDRTTDPITSGWLVEDPNGIYMETFDGNGNSEGYQYVGEPSATLMLIKRPPKVSGQESVSGNSVSENSVSGNGVLDNSVSENTISDNPLEEETEEEEESVSDNTIINENTDNLPIEEKKEEIETLPEEEKKEEIETPTVVEIEVGDESASVYEREVVYGKQILLMSSTSEGALLPEGNTTETGDDETVVLPRYSFYPDDTYASEDEATAAGAIKVAITGGTGADDKVKKITAIYQFSFMGIENNDWFRNYVFGLDSASVNQININVVTCTPAEVTETVISSANMMYWNSKTTNSVEVTNAITILESYISTNVLPCIINYSSNLASNTEIMGNPILNDGHFVKDNIYVINHALNSVSYKDASNNDVLNGIKDPIIGTDVATAFDEVVYRIERDIYERENTPGATSWSENGTVTPALAIQTILTYTKTPAVIEKSHITVLELQPCYSFTYANGNEAAFKSKFLPANSSVEVEIVGMTTSEFCGKIEDINVKYDMIYIGSNTDLMNRLKIDDGDYCTAYNDFNMYGVVYAHTGDLCHIGSHGGSLASNENHTYRYSGNDILEDQETELLEFLQSGAPIVVADDFFIKETVDGTECITKISSGALKNADGTSATVDDTARGENVTGITRNGILDSSSYVYQFVKNACANENSNYGEATWSWENRKYQNFLTEEEIDGENDIARFSTWINQPKMSIHMLSQPTEYNYTTKKVGKSSVIDDSSYLQKEEDGYYLTYEFYISSIASVDIQNTRYVVSLWIDTNMDGKFSDNSENLSGSLLEIENLDTGEEVARDNLKNGVRYRVRRKLPTEIVGAVPWKLQIRHSNNPTLRNAACGITAVRVPEKQKIRVLQLYQGAANIQTYMQEENNHWNALLNNVPDFEVEVESVDATSFFNGSEPKELDSYDMLIVGFADYYQGGTAFKKEVLDDIIAYAQSGKCVLFSHDNTNWNNGKAANLNTYIRDISGLDRYAVSIYRNSTLELFSQNRMITGKDIEKDSKEELVDYLFGSDAMKGYKRDIAFKVNTDQSVMDSRTQGLSYSGNEHDRFVYGENVEQKDLSPLIKKGDIRYKDHYRYFNFIDKSVNPQVEIDKKTWIGQNNYVIDKVNVGAITEYPYRLSNRMKVSSTHGQYFQLDLDSDKDGDGEGDIVVWYTINDAKAGSFNDIYDYSPNDVRNNYYIYNRGNITYTGMGHSNIKDNEEEVKLFINTMIAAYRVAIQSPNLSIVEGNGDMTEKSFDAIAFDGNVSNNATTYKVYFKAEDVNLVSDSIKNLRCRIYMGEGSSTINVNGEDINVTDKSDQGNSGWKLYNTKTNAEVVVQYDSNKKEYYYPIISGEEYYLQVPLVENPTTEHAVVNLSETKSLDIYIEVQSFITKNNKVNESALIYDNFKLTQINLFDLD